MLVRCGRRSVTRLGPGSRPNVAGSGHLGWSATGRTTTGLPPIGTGTGGGGNRSPRSRCALVVLSEVQVERPGPLPVAGRYLKGARVQAGFLETGQCNHQAMIVAMVIVLQTRHHHPQ